MRSDTGSAVRLGIGCKVPSVCIAKLRGASIEYHRITLTYIQVAGGYLRCWTLKGATVGIVVIEGQSKPGARGEVIHQQGITRSGGHGNALNVGIETYLTTWPFVHIHLVQTHSRRSCGIQAGAGTAANRCPWTARVIGVELVKYEIDVVHWINGSNIKGERSTCRTSPIKPRGIRFVRSGHV